MTNVEEKKRRASIQAIMKDPNLNPHERRRSIQYLMDGRRRSSVFQPSFLTPLGNDMSTAAASAAEDFDSSSDDEAYMDSEARQKMTAGFDGKWAAKSKRVSSTCDAADGEQDERHVRLGESFTLGFSEMEMKSLGADGDICESVSASMPASVKSNALWRTMEKSRPTCTHYHRNCSIVSPCCGLVFGCRICHDDYPDLPPPLSKQQSGRDNLSTPVAAVASAPMKTPTVSQHSSSLPMNFDEDEESHHEINRFLIKEVICRECFTLQSSKT